MTDRPKAVMIAARRTAVAPRGGALKAFQADELAAPVFCQLLADAGLSGDQVDQVLLGNALYGGGNPGRLAALRAGLPDTVPALTLDTQCCAGLDAIVLGARLIEAGSARIVLAGGAESFSLAPLRYHRPRTPEEAPAPYSRPPFAPPPFADPDLTDAAARLAAEDGVSREDQAAYAVRSHDKARAAAPFWAERLVQAGGAFPKRDSFTRPLRTKAALRAPVLAGRQATGLTAATIACEADGAAAVLLVSSALAAEAGWSGVLVREGLSLGGSTGQPALVPVDLARRLLEKPGPGSVRQDLGGITAVELMEAYAVQALATVARLSFGKETLNSLGGALARGHPIGASGAILAVHLYERLRQQTAVDPGAPALGLALIAAAGGLASGLLAEGGFAKVDKE